MKITIDTESRTVQKDNEQVHIYSVGSPMSTAIRLVEKMLKIHIKEFSGGSWITNRTR